jgi:hypothetical protein
MNNDFYASNNVSLVLAWIFAVPFLLTIIGAVLSLFTKQEGVPWVFTAWVGLCFLWLSPIRYMLFQLVAACSYPVQSWFAFGTIFYPGIFIAVPIAFSILYALGFLVPLFLMLLITGFKRPPWWRYALAAVAAPVLTLLGSFLFALLLPIAVKFTTHHLRGEDIIRSTNGPAYYVFTYLVTDIEKVDVPSYFDRTPMTSKDYMRTHVAATYLSPVEHEDFVEHAYPQIAEELKSKE